MQRFRVATAALLVVAVAIVVIGLAVASSPVRDILFRRTPDPPVVSCPVPGLPVELIPSQCVGSMMSPSMICNFAGSPYLDRDIPDACEGGQPHQP